jgi:nitrite reductase/ring-hydroxylating ferredoxin subunit
MTNKSKNETQESPQKDRRSFLTKLWVFLGLVALVEIFGVVAAYLRPRRAGLRDESLQAIMEAGPVESFPLNSVTAFVRGKFYLARLEDGGFLALSRKCTHLGCTVPWVADKQRFECPCHASVYSIRGEVTNPPAPRALDLHPVFIENNVVRVDTRKIIKRSSFRGEQVVHPPKT